MINLVIDWSILCFKFLIESIMLMIRKWIDCMSFKNNFDFWIKYIIFLRNGRTESFKHILHESIFFYKCRVSFGIR